MKTKKSTVLSLFLSMMKIGLFTFGGGYAMLALLENEFVSKRGWLERDEFLDMTAIAESTPGPIAINAATYIGYRQAGFFGACAATVGICLPSFAVIYLISLFFDEFLAHREQPIHFSLSIVTFLICLWSGVGLIAELGQMFSH